MKSKQNCKSCKYGDWVVVKPPCEKCIEFSKWERHIQKRKAPEPIYIGHRKCGG